MTDPKTFLASWGIPEGSPVYCSYEQMLQMISAALCTPVALPTPPDPDYFLRPRPQSVPMGEPGFLQCFYCGASVRKETVLWDYFPLPRSAGGANTVPACASCHDMKEKFKLDQWPQEWIGAFWENFHKLPRETKIFLARIARIFEDHLAKQNAMLADKQAGTIPG